MKTKILLCGAVFFVLILTGVCSFADDKEKYGFYIPSWKEELYGTWINTDYTGTGEDHSRPQKLVNYEWGYCETYQKIADKNPLFKWTSFIIDKWVDPDGNVWYKEYQRHPGFIQMFYLNKISKGGTVWECVYDYKMFPQESDLKPINVTYRTWHRK